MEEPIDDCCTRNTKNKPQSNAVGAASVIFMSGGMNIAWSVGFNANEYDKHMLYCWFLAAIIGALFAAILVKFIRKKFLVQFASILVIIGGLLLATTRYNKAAIIVAHYLDGIANGLVFAPTIVLCGEIPFRYTRGLIASSVEQMSFACGIFVQILCNSFNVDSNTPPSFNFDQLQGVLSIIYGSMALLASIFLMKESPVMLLALDQEYEAIDLLRQLQRPFTITNETYQQLQEHKLYLSTNRKLTPVQSAANGATALIRLCVYRGLNSMSFSIFITSALANLTVSKGTYTILSYVVVATARWLGSIIPIFLLDSLGCKKILITGFFVAAATAFGIAAIFGDQLYFLKNNLVMTSLMLQIIYQFFAATAAIPSTVYLTEAFPLAVKDCYITIAFVVEMLVQLIIICCNITQDGIIAYFYVLGSLSFAYCIFAYFCLPETKRTTLIQAQEKFKHLLVKKGF